MALLGRTKKEVLLEFRTSEILHAARSVFATHGYARATVDEIAEVAGLAKGTIYLYFPSKQDLFLAALREGVEQLHAQARDGIAQAVTVQDKIRAFVNARLDYCGRNREFFRIYYTEFASVQVRSSNAQPEFQDLYEQQLRVLESVIEEGIASGEIRPLESAKVARLVYEVTRSAVAQHMLAWPDQRPEETTELVTDLIWRGIGC